MDPEESLPQSFDSSQFVDVSIDSAPPHEVSRSRETIRAIVFIYVVYLFRYYIREGILYRSHVCLPKDIVQDCRETDP